MDLIKIITKKMYFKNLELLQLKMEILEFCFSLETQKRRVFLLNFPYLGKSVLNHTWRQHLEAYLEAPSIDYISSKFDTG